MIDERLRQKAQSIIGSVRRKVMAEGNTETIAAVGEKMLCFGVELTEQSGAEAADLDVENYPEHVGRIAVLERLLKYRENDIKALKAIIGDRNKALKLVKARKVELRARIRELEIQNE